MAESEWMDDSGTEWPFVLTSSTSPYRRVSEGRSGASSSAMGFSRFASDGFVGVNSLDLGALMTLGCAVGKSSMVLVNPSDSDSNSDAIRSTFVKLWSPSAAARMISELSASLARTRGSVGPGMIAY